MRLFLAIDLPQPVRRELGELQDRLRADLRGWRWVRPEGIHLTLRFLGEVDADGVARQRDTWRRAVRSCPAVRFGLGGIGVFPPRGAPRVLWVGVSALDPADGLTRLATSIETAARAEGFPAEKRPFRPHLTLARAERRGHPQRPEKTGDRRLAEVDATEVVLFESRLEPRGARYTALEAFPLSVAPSQVPSAQRRDRPER